MCTGIRENKSHQGFKCNNSCWTDSNATYIIHTFICTLTMNTWFTMLQNVSPHDGRWVALNLRSTFVYVVAKVNE